jgi:hypothetical protein
MLVDSLKVIYLLGRLGTHQTIAVALVGHEYEIVGRTLAIKRSDEP